MQTPQQDQQSKKKITTTKFISIYSLTCVLIMLHNFNKRAFNYLNPFSTNLLLDTPHEFILKTVARANTSKIVECKLYNIYIMPNFHGPFPDQYKNFELKSSDVIFDTSPAGFQPWIKHRSKLKHYFTFKYQDATKYSIDTVNKTVLHEEYLKLVNHYRKILAYNHAKFMNGTRFIFLCNIPRCITNVVMALAFFNLTNTRFTHPCQSIDYNPLYFQRILETSEYDPFQYMTYEFNNYPTFNKNYDPEFFKHEDTFSTNDPTCF
jgi:hypothetical protein